MLFQVIIGSVSYLAACCIPVEGMLLCTKLSLCSALFMPLLTLLYPKALFHRPAADLPPPPTNALSTNPLRWPLQWFVLCLGCIPACLSLVNPGLSPHPFDQLQTVPAGLREDQQVKPPALCVILSVFVSPFVTLLLTFFSSPSLLSPLSFLQTHSVLYWKHERVIFH